MTDFPSVKSSDSLYLQPTRWCAPDYQHPGGWVQVAGLPVWAAGIRLIVRAYDGRTSDQVFSIAEIKHIINTIDRPDVTAQWHNIIGARNAWTVGGKTLAFAKPLLMAILNATPDSFSDGGDHFDLESALRAAQQMVEQGADIIDIGGESTRPGAKVVWEGEEIERVTPVLQGTRHLGLPISLDTRKAAVMDAGLDAGAHIINDVSALTFDDTSLELIAKRNCPIIIMHAQGDPQVMQDAPGYDDVVLDVYDFLANRLEMCVEAGIDPGRIAIDPGIGFGKTLQHNLALIQNLALFHGLGCPILLGVSRKRFIGALSDTASAKDRLAGSLTAAMAGLQQGVHMLRVHDVTETRQMLDVWQGFGDAQQMPPAS